ncbi:unnamed protein product [Ranitomeya imitator]|uniref:Plexin cytoplasmic RasGAP domain-containing protein n=1 Tax=Ranitomeya imitator TaxID=111125 RepID=A0ABN9LDX7_9NEOB|nr:unnamed protein product [Ranitomeya imitator]
METHPTRQANKCLGNSTHCHLQAPRLGEKPQTYNINLRIQDTTTICGELIYKTDPIFETFYLLNYNNNEIELLIEKREDDLGIQAHEIGIQIHYKDVELSCEVWNVTVVKQNSIQCKARNVFKGKIDAQNMLVKRTSDKMTIAVHAPKTYVITLPTLLHWLKKWRQAHHTKRDFGAKVAYRMADPTQESAEKGTLKVNVTGVPLQSHSDTDPINTSLLTPINLGNFNVDLKPQKENYAPYYFILLVVPLLLIVVIAAYLITRHKSKELSKKLSKDLVELECEIRKEIREGFAELQTDKEVVTMEALGTIPFFDYKHFALNTFFPEPFQTRRSTQDEEIVKTLKTLFENQNFLVLLIHTLEKQNDFTIKDRCMFASFLTINFQSNLLYLTGLLENLTKDLIEQSNNKHPKLMLRRTETVVEKLLTNWMSTCLYGFLRVSKDEDAMRKALLSAHKFKFYERKHSRIDSPE